VVYGNLGGLSFVSEPTPRFGVIRPSP
jgi:hypothetical protein